ncbi:MAG: hypothetical protein RIC80_18700 [Cyclobacteriaceae bacterium]
MTQELQNSIAYLDEQEKQVVMNFISSLDPQRNISRKEHYRREAMREIRQALEKIK